MVCPLFPLRGNRFLFTCVNRFARWFETIPLANNHTKTVTPTHPTAVPSVNQRFSSNCEFMDCKRIRTIAYQTATNGMAERLRGQLKAAEHWVDNLLVVLLGIRSSFRPKFNAGAAELVYES